MKILVVSNELGIGGIERTAQVFALELHRRPGVHVYYGAWLTGGPRAELLIAAGIAVLDLGRRPLADIVREIGIDTVFTHGIDPARFLAVKQEVLLIQETMFRDRYSAVADINFVVSHALGCKIALSVPDFRNLAVLYNPVDIDRWEQLAGGGRALRTRLKIGDDRFVIGRVARPEPSKWDYLFIASVRRILRRRAEVVLLLVGAPLLYRIFLWPHRGRIRYCPPSGDDRFLAAAYEACDLFFHTAQRGETFGNVIAEAMTFGRPILTHSTDFRAPGGCVRKYRDNAQIELVRHGENGFVVQGPDEALRCVERLIDEPALRARIEANNREKARTEFAARNLIDRFLAIVTAVRKGERPFASGPDLKRRYAAFFTFQNRTVVSFEIRRAGFIALARLYTVARRLLRLLFRFDLESI